MDGNDKTLPTLDELNSQHLPTLDDLNGSLHDTGKEQPYSVTPTSQERQSNLLPDGRPDYFKPLGSEKAQGLSIINQEGKPSYTALERSVILGTIDRLENNPIFKNPVKVDAYYNSLAQQGYDVNKIKQGVELENQHKVAQNQVQYNPIIKTLGAPVEAIKSGAKSIAEAGQAMSPEGQAQTIIEGASKGEGGASIVADLALKPVAKIAQGVFGLAGATPEGQALYTASKAIEEAAGKHGEQINQAIMAPVSSAFQIDENSPEYAKALGLTGDAVVGLLYAHALGGGKITPEVIEKSGEQIKNYNPEQLQQLSDAIHTPEIVPDVIKKNDLENDLSKINPENPAAQILGTELQKTNEAIDQKTASRVESHAAEVVNNPDLINQTRAQLEASKEGMSETGKALVDQKIAQLPPIETPKEDVNTIHVTPEGQAPVNSEGIPTTDATGQSGGESVVPAAEENQPVQEQQSENQSQITTDSQVNEVAQQPTVEPPPATPTESTAVTDGEQVKKTITTERAYEGTVREETKKYLEEKGLTREKVPQEVRSQQAEDLIKEKGEDIAIEAVKSGDVRGAQASSVLAKVIKNIDEKIAESRDNNEVMELAKKQADLIDFMGKEGYLGGEFNSQLAYEYEHSDIGYSLGNMLKEKMESSGVDKLTDEQKTEVQKSYDAIVKAKEEAQAKVTELEKALAEEKAKKEVERVSRTRKRGLTKEKLDEEFTSLADELSKIAKESMVASSGVNPVLASKAAGVIAKMVRNRVEKGVVKLTDVIEHVYEKVKGTGLTKQDIHDIISGKYAEKRETKNEIAAKLRDLKDEAAAINRLEQLERGQIPTNEKAKVARNKEITDLREKIKGLKKETEIAQGLVASKELPTVKEKEQIALERVKAQNEAKTKKYNEKIKNKDYSPDENYSVFDDPLVKYKYPELRNEALDAISKREDAKHQWHIDKIKDELANRNKAEKLYDYTRHIITTARGLMAGIDDSFAFMQAGFTSLTNPKQFGKAFVEHAKDTFSEQRFERELTALHNSPVWNMVHKSGLDILEPKSIKEREREGILDVNLLNEDIKINGKTYNVGKYTIRPFERAFISLGNNLRLNLFLRQADGLLAEGKTFETHPQEFKDLAEVINTNTGRGKVHKYLDNDLTRMAIWSPKLLSASLNTLGASDIINPITRGKKGYYARLTPEARSYAIKQTVKGIGLGLGIMAINKYSGGYSDLDPTSVGFGEVGASKDGYKINVFGRFAPIIRFYANEIMGYKTYSGVKKPINRGMEVLHFIRGKASPIPGYVVSAAVGKDYTGEKFDATRDALRLVTPLSISEISKGLEQDGSISLLKRGIPAFEGMKVSNPKDFQNQNQPDNSLQDLHINR